jgi:hypothetical protein
MKTGPALALIAVGAILAFAVHAHLSLPFNLCVCAVR